MYKRVILKENLGYCCVRQIFVRLLTHCVSYIKKHSGYSSSKLNSCILKISKHYKVQLKEII